jgi:hypothetical protein
MCVCLARVREMKEGRDNLTGAGVVDTGHWTLDLPCNERKRVDRWARDRLTVNEGLSCLVQ